MALCHICSTIPFDSLPSLPEWHGRVRIADKDELPAFTYRNEKMLPDDAIIGFPWHRNYEVLAASAPSCPLCGLVQKGVEAWLHAFDDASRNNKHFKEFDKGKSQIPVGQQLWLTKRTGGAPGFMVLARVKDLSQMVYFLAGASFSVEADSPWALDFPQRPVEQNSGSLRSLRLVHSWLKTCLDTHKTCEGISTILPSRVLDISSADDNIKLVDGAGRSGQYVSLSYCWGTGPRYTTHQESIRARQAGFKLSELPRTLHDAVIITRHLGINYLWIDSLCICQDDEEEWARESARMSEVYSNAHVVIAANHAKNNAVGCFHDRPARPEVALTLPGWRGSEESNVKVRALLLYNGDELPWIQCDYDGEPLSGRGWGLQERILAKRILHYNKRQLFFECNNGIFSEDGFRDEHRFCSRRKQPFATATEVQATHSQWNQILLAYGRRVFSKPTDKMPALSGLAKSFAGQLRAEYVAGLWSDDLIEGLAWQGLLSTRRPSESPSLYIGPSWSWASFNGIAATGVRYRGFKDIAKVEDWHVQPKTEANPYGEVTSAWIRLRAPTTKLLPSPVAVTEYDRRLTRAGSQPFPRVLTQYSEDEEGMILILDKPEIQSSGEWREQNPQLLILGGYTKSDTCIPKQAQDDDDGKEEEEDTGFKTCFCMAVVKEGDAQGVEKLRRVGWLFLGKEEVAKVIADEESWKTVVLV